MTSRIEQRTSGGHRCLRLWALTALALPLGLIPALAGAAETDRVTVEDPATGQIMFRVTSAGNVTGAAFNGDGLGLANVAHYKGAWSAGTTYKKDDCVLYAGSSYIALQVNVNAQPNLSPASWAVLAQQGIQGVKGDKGDTGATGATGPAGSPDTQLDILAKLSGATDNTTLSLLQGPSESSSLPKFKITDRSGLERLAFIPVGMLNLTGTNSEIHNKVINNVTRPVFVGERARGTVSAPTNVVLDDKLGTFAFSGYDGAAYQTGALLEVFVDGAVSSGSVPSRFSIVTGNSYSNRAERLVVKSSGSVGIGTAAPTQKLEVKDGGVRINTAANVTKPACDSTTRGTFWITQSGAGAEDVLEVCVKNASEAYVWKAVW